MTARRADLHQSAADGAGGLDDSAFDLQDTVADEPLRDGAEGDELTFDNIFGREIVPLEEVDPEAGSMSVGRRVRREMRRVFGTPGGRLIVAMVFALAGVTLAIMALVHQTPVLLASAGVIAPIWLVGWIVCYRRWLGHKRYAYRVLESLGEDVSDFAPSAIYRARRTRARSRKRR